MAKALLVVVETLLCFVSLLTLRKTLKCTMSITLVLFYFFTLNFFPDDDVELEAVSDKADPVSGEVESVAVEVEPVSG